jgi:hypothetical protein
MIILLRKDPGDHLRRHLLALAVCWVSDQAAGHKVRAGAGGALYTHHRSAVVALAPAGSTAVTARGSTFLVNYVARTPAGQIFRNTSPGLESSEMRWAFTE